MQLAHQEETVLFFEGIISRFPIVSFVLMISFMLSHFFFHRDLVRSVHLQFHLSSFVEENQEEVFFVSSWVHLHKPKLNFHTMLGFWKFNNFEKPFTLTFVLFFQLSMMLYRFHQKELFNLLLYWISWLCLENLIYHISLVIQVTQLVMTLLWGLLP